jgi:hypothetical protein
MFKPIRFPRGIANLFSIGLCSKQIVGEGYQHRPDKLSGGMKEELINNNLSNISPISCEKGKVYSTASQMFIGWCGSI